MAQSSENVSSSNNRRTYIYKSIYLSKSTKNVFFVLHVIHCNISYAHVLVRVVGYLFCVVAAHHMNPFESIFTRGALTACAQLGHKKAITSACLTDS